MAPRYQDDPGTCPIVFPEIGPSVLSPIVWNFEVLSGFDGKNIKK